MTTTPTDIPAGYTAETIDLYAAELHRLVKDIPCCHDVGLYAAIITPEGVSVTPRAELVSRLRSADLMAHVAKLTRRTPGKLAVWFESEGETGLSFLGGWRR